MDEAPFTWKTRRNGVLLAAFVEERDRDGRRNLVAEHVDGGLSEREYQELHAAALSAWLHPTDPPSEWFGPAE